MVKEFFSKINILAPTKENHKKRMKLRYIYLFLLTIALSSCGITLEDANRAYDLYRFDEAASMYEELYKEKDRDKAERAAIAFKAAESYREQNKWRDAERWYEKAIRRGYPNPEVYYQLAMMQVAQEKGDDAIENFKKYKEKLPGAKEKANEGIEKVRRYEDWRNDTTRYVVEKADRVSSRKNDFAPSYFKNRENLVFTSDREVEGGSNDEYRWTGFPFSDIFIAEWDQKREWYGDTKQLEGNINTEFNEGVTSFDKRGRKIYYTQCNGPEGEKTNCRIMVARKRGRKAFKDPEKLPFCEDSTVNYANPSIAKNGKKIFFTANLEDSRGGRDLYVSHYVSRSRTWGDPVNLGDKINTKYDESFPYIYNNDKLYFSSKGHNSVGGYDIFVTEWDGESWSEPENLKYPINGPTDDFGLVLTENGNQGHFSSNRDRGTDDIYGFFLKELNFYLSGKVYNSKTGDSVANSVVKLASNKMENPDTVHTNKFGEYEFELKPKSRYEIDATKEEFFRSQKKFLATVGYEYSRSFKRDLEIEPYPPKEIEIKGIYYALDSAYISDSSKKALDSLVNIMKANPTIKIELRSHTDCRAPKDYNRKLSQRRADSAVDYLRRNGIDSARMVPEGYGEDSLVNNCRCEDGEGPGLECTEAEHQENRRTTFKIISTDYQPERPELNEEGLEEEDAEEGDAEEEENSGSDTQDMDESGGMDSENPEGGSNSPPGDSSPDNN